MSHYLQEAPDSSHCQDNIAAQVYAVLSQSSIVLSKVVAPSMLLGQVCVEARLVSISSSLEYHSYNNLNHSGTLVSLVK